MLAEFLLHFDDIGAEPVFSGELKAVRVMIDFLVIVQTFIHILLVGLTGPEQVPIVRVRLLEHVRLQHRPDQLGLALHQLEEHGR